MERAEVHGVVARVGKEGGREGERE